MKIENENSVYFFRTIKSTENWRGHIKVTRTVVFFKKFNENEIRVKFSWKFRYLFTLDEYMIKIGFS